MAQDPFAKYFQPATPQAQQPVQTDPFAKYFQPEQDQEETKPSTLQRIKAAVPEPIRNTVATVFDYLGRPGAATAGAINALQTGEDVSDRVFANLKGERRDDFDQVLEDAGMEDSTLRHVAGFVGDVVVDPLNLVGVGAVKNLAKAAGAAAKLPEAGRAIKGAVKAADAALGGHGAELVDDLGKKFVPYHGLPEDYARERRLLDAELGTIEERKVSELRERFKGTDPQFRKEVAEDIEAGAGRTPDHDALSLQQHQINDDLFTRQENAGVIRPSQYVPDHVRHDFTDKMAQDPNFRTAAKSVSAKNRNARKRLDVDETIQDAVAKGAEPDLAKIQFRYEKEAERASRVGEFIQDTAAKHGQDTTGWSKQQVDALVARGWDEIDIPMESPLKGKVDKILLPKEIAQNLSALRLPPREQGKVEKLASKLMGMWRTQATVLRPGHHMTNFSGNTFNAFLGGLDPIFHPLRFAKAYTDAAIWSRIPDATQIGNYSKSQVEEAMNKLGVGHWHTNNLTSELGDVDHANALVRKIAEDKAGRTLGTAAKSVVRHPVQTAKKVGSEIENFSKRALFVDQIRRGKSIEEAYEHTQKFLFNYAELTDFEKRYMRNLFPFYTWMRKNIPLQAEQVVKQPHKYAAASKAQNAVENVTEEKGVSTPDEFRPEYLQELNAVQLPTEKGDPKQYLTPYLPYQELNMLPVNAEGGERALSQLLSSVNPLIRIPGELGFNKVAFTGAPVYNKALGMAEDTSALPASLQALPKGLKDLLFTQVQGKNGPQHEINSIARYALMQSPLAESLGKAGQAAIDPEAKNPFALESFVTGVKRTQRTRQQEQQDRKRAIDDSKAKNRERKKQRPISKTRLEEIKRKLAEGG